MKQDQEQSQHANHKCVLEYISREKKIMAAPTDWQVAMEQVGHSSWHAVARVAYELRCAFELGPPAWLLVQNAVGVNDAAIIASMADANSCERSGPVQSIEGWVRRMAERADASAANFNRSLSGLLHQAEVLC